MVQAPYTKGAHGYMINPLGARELISKAKCENDRKEFLFLVKKAAKLRSKFEITN